MHKVNISFKNNDADLTIYEYIKTKRDKSAYIKDLIELDLQSKNLKSTPTART